MNGFREWLSDNLRYLMLLAAVLLGIGAIVLGVKMFRVYREDKQTTKSAQTQENTSGDVVILGQEDGSEAAEPASAAAQMTEMTTAGQESIGAGGQEPASGSEEDPAGEQIQTESPAGTQTETDASAPKVNGMPSSVPDEAVSGSKTVRAEETGVTQTPVKAQADTQKETAAQTEKSTQTETAAQTEKNTQTETAAQTEKSTQKTTAAQTEKSTQKETTAQTEKNTRKETAAQTEKSTQKAASQTEKSTQKETTAQTDPSKQTGRTVSRPDVSIVGQAETLPQTESLSMESGAFTPAQTEAVSQSETTVQTETVRQTEEIDTLISMAATTKYASSGANVRSGPGTGYTALGDVSQGSSLEVTGQTSSWYQIRYNGRTAYISKSLVTDVYTPVYMTMTGTCYLRSEADYGDNIIGEYYAGTTVEYLGDAGGWVHVRVDGMDGYMGRLFFR